MVHPQNPRQERGEMAAWGDRWDRLVTLLSRQPGAPGVHELIVGLVAYSRETAEIEPDHVPTPASAPDVEVRW